VVSTGDDSAAESALLNSPTSIWMNMIGIGEYYGYRIRMIEGSSGIIFTVAGTSIGGDDLLASVAATSALIKYIEGFTGDTAGTIYFMDYDNLKIRQMDENADSKT
jgi:hypothetical protein